MDCVSYAGAANGLHPRPAGLLIATREIQAKLGVAPGQWLQWSQTTRLSHLRAAYAMDMTRETLAQYEARLRSLASQITTQAFASVQRTRPAGASTLPFSGDNLAGTGGAKDTGGTGTGTGTGTTPSTWDIAAGVLGTAATTLQNIVAQGNQTERDRIETEARTHLEELRIQSGQTSDPSLLAAIQRQIDAMQAVITRTTGGNTMTYVAIAAVVVILAGGAYYVMSNRHPVETSVHVRHNPVVEDAYGNRRFVPGWRLTPR